MIGVLYYVLKRIQEKINLFSLLIKGLKVQFHWTITFHILNNTDIMIQKCRIEFMKTNSNPFFKLYPVAKNCYDFKNINMSRCSFKGWF